MKTKFIPIISIASALALAACSGNHSATDGKDTSTEKFGAPRQDTSTTPRSTDGETAIDNSGSGGTKIPKDTAKKQDAKKK